MLDRLPRIKIRSTVSGGRISKSAISSWKGQESAAIMSTGNIHPCRPLSEKPGKGNEVFDTEFFRAEVEDLGGQEFRQLHVVPSFPPGHCRGERFKGIPESLPPLVETGLHYGPEQFLIASESRASVALQPYHGGFHFRWRVEGPFAYSEQVFDVVPGLQKDGQYAIGLRPGFSAMRSATSFCIMQTTCGILSL